nr:hypothetical protein [uncultured Nitrososphaera sp.]
MVLPKHDPELARWLIREAVEDSYFRIVRIFDSAKRSEEYKYQRLRKLSLITSNSDDAFLAVRIVLDRASESSKIALDCAKDYDGHYFQKLFLGAFRQ